MRRKSASQYPYNHCYYGELDRISPSVSYSMYRCMARMLVRPTLIFLLLQMELKLEFIHGQRKQMLFPLYEKSSNNGSSNLLMAVLSLVHVETLKFCGLSCINLAA
jgi:hypothetical protein